MLKLKRVFKKSLVILLAVFLAFSFYNFLNGRSIKQNEEEILKKDLEEKEKLDIEFELQKKQHDENLERTRRFKQQVINETQIAILQEKGSMQVNSLKNKGENNISKFLFESNISMTVNYLASIGIDTANIVFSTEENGKVVLKYSSSDIYVLSVEISKILCDTKNGIFAEQYEPSEVSALTVIAKDKIREEIEDELTRNFYVSQKLENYLRLEALKFQIFDVLITVE